MRLKRFAVLSLLAGSLVASPAAASTTDAAFNQTTGALNVNYASYLSKHDIVYNRPNTNALHGLTVGNGHTGAMVWQQNGLTMQVSGVDLSQQSAFAAGLANLATTPAMDSGYSTYQQRLSLYDGTLTTKYDSNRTVTIMGSPNSEVMGIHVDDTRGGISNISFELSMWDPASVGNSADVPDINTWRTVSTFADSTAAGLSRGQTDANNFGYTFAATVEGAAFTTQVVNSTRVRVNITPAPSYTIWLTAPGGASGGLVNDTDLTYSANWHHTTGRGYGDYNDDTHHTNTVNAEASYTFTGTGIEYLSERFSDMGNVDVYLDGAFQANVNLFVSGPRQAQAVVWSKTGLSNGQHTIRIVAKTTSVQMVDALRIATSSSGGVALRAIANGKYVSAANAGAAPLIANATAVGAWEQFDLIDRGGGNVALRARVNNKYVCAENAGASALIANRDAIGGWEKFEIVTL